MYNYRELEFELVGSVSERQHFHPDIEISVLQGENCVFFCNSVLNPRLSYGELRAVFHDLVYQHVRGKRKTYCRRDSLLFQLLDILVEKFHFHETVETEGNPWHDERISRIIHYVNRNYQTGISLTELAEDMDDIFEHREPVTLDITLQDIPAGRYEIKKQTVNREHGSILDEWKMFGYAHNLDSSDMKYLREICIPHLSLQWQEVQNCQMKISVKLKEQEISLIHVYEKN